MTEPEIKDSLYAFYFMKSLECFSENIMGKKMFRVIIGHGYHSHDLFFSLQKRQAWLIYLNKTEGRSYEV